VLDKIIDTRHLLEELGLDVIYTDSKEPRSAQMLQAENLTPDIQSLIQEMLPSGLYRHQAKAIDCACAGENFVICTGTASGKTLAFAIPVLQKLLEDSKARALFFYPTKALSGDQSLAVICQVCKTEKMEIFHKEVSKKTEKGYSK